MDDLDGADNYSSDDEINPQAHKKLLSAVNRIGKIQHIKKPSRNEPALAQDEFNLVKGTTRDAGKVQDSIVSVSDLVKVLNKTSSHLGIGNELKNTRKNKKVLQKPLEKPVADRIHRQIGYDTLKKQLSKWDAVVTRNRAAEQQIFPLQYEEIKVDIKETQKPPQYCLKSDLMIKFEEIETQYRPKPEKLISDEDKEKKLQETLTKEELIARRKKLAYLRMKESQQSAKARMRNKIKSKKYHKLLKRQKLKEQMQEFEALQKINPEAALVKLEKIEKSRVLERASLRHKNTGTWAKNLKVRSKYDKDVQKDLAEQLALSRELTSKLKQENEDTEDEPDEDNGQEDEIDPFNPWMKGKKKNEIAEFVTGYRKYWMERNKNEEIMEEYKKDSVNSNQENSEKDCSYEQGDIDSHDQIEKTDSKKLVNDAEENKKEVEFEAEFEEIEPQNRKGCKKNVPNRIKMNKGNSLKKSEKENPKMKKASKANCEVKKLEDGWVVEDNEEMPERKKDIDDMFDEAEDKMQEKVYEKLGVLSKSLQKRENKSRYNLPTSKNKDHLDLSFKKQVLRPEFDEKLLEAPVKDNNETEDTKKDMKVIENPIAVSIKEENYPDKRVEAIDPNNFVTVKARTFQTELADIINSGGYLDDDNEDDDAIDKQLSLAAAFEDEDLEADFQKDRKEERNKNSTQDVDLTLPGWGSWAGSGMGFKKRKRLVLKFPEQEKRRDDNKEKVYINENENKKLKSHLVSDLPFPFTSVKDYEASIRAPIGSDFVPETAFRMMTRPAVITKMGHIIEAMKEDDLLKPPKRPRNVIDKRIDKYRKFKVEKKI